MLCMRRAVPAPGSTSSVEALRRLATSASQAAEQMMAAFEDKPTTRCQYLDGNQLQRLSLTLNRRYLHPGIDISVDPPPKGTVLPPGYHLVYFTPTGVENELGHDGTDRTFNAPKPFTRRMWAGGRMSWVGGSRCRLKVGEEAEERTRLLSATPKKGRGGNEMVLVEVEKEFWTEKGLALVDQRSWIFRLESEEESPVAVKPLHQGVVRGSSTVEDTTTTDSGYPIRNLRWSPVGLFRFSALTFNGHKIHYDHCWTSTVEGHPVCVVHGPLNLICMLDYWRDHCKRDKDVQVIDYRATYPLYAGDSYHIRTAGQNKTADGYKTSWEVLVERNDRSCMTGNIVA